MILNLAVTEMFEDMCGYLMMYRDARGSWLRLSYSNVVRRFAWPEGLTLISMYGTSVPECAHDNSSVSGYIPCKSSKNKVWLAYQEFQVWVIDAQ